MAVWHHQTVCPYELIVYALDTKLNLKPGFRFNDLHFAIQGHILDQAVIMGTYDV